MMTIYTHLLNLIVRGQYFITWFIVSQSIGLLLYALIKLNSEPHNSEVIFTHEPEPIGFGLFHILYTLPVMLAMFLVASKIMFDLVINDKQIQLLCKLHKNRQINPKNLTRRILILTVVCIISSSVSVAVTDMRFNDFHIATILSMVSTIWVSICASQLRRCGHGCITNIGRDSFLFVPWEVNPCPVCGDDMSFPAEEKTE